MTKQVNKHSGCGQRTGWLWLAGSLVCLMTVTSLAQSPADPAPNRCGTVEYERILQQRHPDRLRRMIEMNRRLKEAETNGKALRQSVNETVYQIPIVVHVVHSTASNEIGGPTNNVNISEEQIISQIQVLNEDYRRQPGTNGANTNPIGADAGIQFFLAKTDPSGQPSTGITRHYYPQKTSFNVFSDAALLSRIAYWPSDRYLNIWVADLESNYLGFTTEFPSTADTLSGLPGDTNESLDGTIIDYQVFGRQTGAVTGGNYALGRTATHEIGHWLGLLHTWGDTDCGEDYVADTPPTKGPNERQCRTTFSNCNNRGQTRDLTEDYMDYSPDACMNLFTKGQVARMRAVLELSPRRARLIRSATGPLAEAENLTINVYPNPASIDPVVDVQLKGLQSFTVDLFNTGGRRLRTLSYTDVPSTSVVVPTADLPAGLYIVRVKTDREVVSKRLLVQ